METMEEPNPDDYYQGVSLKEEVEAVVGQCQNREEINRANNNTITKIVEKPKNQDSCGVTTNPANERTSTNRKRWFANPGITCFKCGSNNRSAGEPFVKSTMNYIYDKLENFYSNFKPNKTVPLNVWSNETPTKTGKVRPLLCAERNARSFLWKLGGKLADAPTLMLVVPLLVCALSTVGLIVRRKHLEFNQPFALLHSTDASTGRQWFDGVVPANPKFRSMPLSSGAHYVVLFQTAASGNVLTDETIETYLKLKQKLDAVRVPGGENGNFLKYSAMCRRESRDTCAYDVVESVITMERSTKLQYPETRLPLSHANGSATVDVYLGDKVGGAVVDLQGNLNSADSLALYFKLAPKFEREFEKWDAEFQRVMRNERFDESRLKITWWSAAAYRKAALDVVRTAYGYLSWSLLVISVLTVAAFVVGCSKNRSSHPVAGVFVVVIVVAVVGASINIDLAINADFNPAIFPCYFLIAASVLFVAVNLLHSWRKYSNFEITPKQKFRFLLSWEMPSFVYACLTMTCAFGVTSLCIGLPLFQRTFHFMMIGSLFLLVLVLFLYCGVLYWSGKRENAGLRWYQFGSSKKKLAQDNYHRFAYSYKGVEKIHKKLLEMPTKSAYNLMETLNSAHFRYISLLLFVAYLIFGVWGYMLADVQLHEIDYLQDGENLHKFLADYKRQFGESRNFLELTFDGPIDYYNPGVRRLITDMLSWVKSELNCAEQTISWLADFNVFEQTVASLINRQNFLPIINYAFLRHPKYRGHSSDILLDPNNDQILASRMYVRLNENGASRLVEIANGLVSRAESHGIRLKITTPAAFDAVHDMQIQRQTFVTFFIALLLLCVCTLVAFAQPLLTFTVIIFVWSVAMGTVGYSAWWGVPANAFSVNTVLAGMGYSSLICITFCYLYNNADDDTGSKQRIWFAIGGTWRGLIWSNLIILSAFLPMLLIEADYLSHQLRLLFCHSLICCLHYCMFLPALLKFYSSTLLACCQAWRRCLLTICFSTDNNDYKAKNRKIYYVPISPTTPALVDPGAVQEFYKLKFREDIIGQPPPLPAPLPLTSPDEQRRHEEENPSAVPGVLNPEMSKVYRYSAQMSDPNEGFVRVRGDRSNLIYGLIDTFHAPNVSDYVNGWNPKILPDNKSRDRKPPYDLPPLRDRKPGRSQSVEPLSSRDIDRHVMPKNKISYSKWTKEVPLLNGKRTERVIAEKYVIEADGAEVHLSPSNFDKCAGAFPSNLYSNGRVGNLHKPRAKPQFFDANCFYPGGEKNPPFHHHAPPPLVPHPSHVHPFVPSAPPPPPHFVETGSPPPYTGVPPAPPRRRMVPNNRPPVVVNRGNVKRSGTAIGSGHLNGPAALY